MPFQRVGIDLVGELLRCDGDKKANTVAEELQKYPLLFGQPTDAVVTDNGREFANAAFDELTKKWGCRTTHPYFFYCRIGVFKVRAELRFKKMRMVNKKI